MGGCSVVKTVNRDLENWWHVAVPMAAKIGTLPDRHSPIEMVAVVSRTEVGKVVF